MSSGDKFARPASSRRLPPNRSRLMLEQLESREVPATLATINDFTTPTTKDLYVPLTVTNSTKNVDFTTTSSDTHVHAQLVTGGTTVKLHVTGKAADGTDFSGDLTLRLFDSLAPATTARILDIINHGVYDGLTFHRILAGFVAQGGDPAGNGTGGTGLKLNDEITTQLTFNSPGLLAMANSGPDSSDSQFFITDPSVPLAPNLQSLNFRYTIFGQLVAGFDTFDKLIHTPVSTSGNGKPLSTVTITSATVVKNDPNGVLRVTADAGFTGTSSITVTPREGGQSGTADTFNVTFATDTINDAPFLGPIADQTTTVGTPVTFPLTATDLENDPLTYSVVSATNATNGTAVAITSSINQSTGRVTITPPADFAGTIKLKVGVKDATSSVDTQVINLVVTGAPATNIIDLDSNSDTGALTDDNVTGANTPSFTITAPTGQTVTVTVNGKAAGTAKEKGNTGKYNITLAANLLQVGANTITGTVTPKTGTATTLTPLTVTYNPSLANVYVVPGTIGSTQQITFQFSSAESNSKSEFGFFKVDDATGKIGTLTPGSAGYFAAAMARRQIVFAKGATVGASQNVTVNGGDLLVTYLVQGDTSANLMSQNPTNAKTAGKPIAFFSIVSANSDTTAHVFGADDVVHSQTIMGWEDGTSGGDQDYNDMVVSVRKFGDTLSGTLVVPTVTSRTVTVTTKLQTPTKASTGTGSPTSGEVGLIVTDDVTGKIGNLQPGDVGYAAAALARAQILFANGAAVGTVNASTLTGGQNFMFYYVPGGTAAQVVSGNPTNIGSGSKVAYFSIAGGNPDKVTHSRFFNPEQVKLTTPTPSGSYVIHMMGKLNGTAKDFDDVVFSLKFGA